MNKIAHVFQTQRNSDTCGNCGGTRANHMRPDEVSQLVAARNAERQAEEQLRLDQAKALGLELFLLMRSAEVSYPGRLPTTSQDPLAYSRKYFRLRMWREALEEASRLAGLK